MAGPTGINPTDAKIRRMLEGAENVVYDELHSIVLLEPGPIPRRVDFFARATDLEHLTDCSLREDQKLPRGEDFLIQSIMLRPDLLIDNANFDSIFRMSRLVLKVQARGGIERSYTTKSLGGAGGKFGNQLVDSFSNGVPQKNSAMVLQVPELLEQQEQFEVYALFPAALTIEGLEPVKLELVFAGLHSNNVGAKSK